MGRIKVCCLSGSVGGIHPKQRFVNQPRQTDTDGTDVFNFFPVFLDLMSNCLCHSLSPSGVAGVRQLMSGRFPPPVFAVLFSYFFARASSDFAENENRIFFRTSSSSFSLPVTQEIGPLVGS